MAGTHVRTRARPALLSTELDRLLAEVAGSVDDVVSRPHPTPESLHQLHREMRRLRHALVVWQRLLTRRDEELVRPLDRRLKRLARLVGRVRDRDVMIDLIEGGSLPKPSRRDERLVTRWSARLRDDARTGRELLLVYLRSERDAHLFEGLRESVEFVPRKGAMTALPQVLDAEQEERHAEVRSARHRARRRPTSARLHHLRIQVRRLRHLAEVRGRLAGKNGAVLPPAVRRLQSRLGRLHDLDLVLGGLDADLLASDWGQALKSDRRSVRRAIRRSLRAISWPKLEPRDARRSVGVPGRAAS